MRHRTSIWVALLATLALGLASGPEAQAQNVVQYTVQPSPSGGFNYNFQMVATASGNSAGFIIFGDVGTGSPGTPAPANRQPLGTGANGMGGVTLLSVSAPFSGMTASPTTGAHSGPTLSPAFTIWQPSSAGQTLSWSVNAPNLVTQGNLYWSNLMGSILGLWQVAIQVPLPPVDADGDGVPDTTDCDDNNAANFPGNTEICDGQDNDCNGLDDMGNPGLGGQETDNDADGQSECQGDCDDNNAANFSGNTELCDGQDNDCDGTANADAAGEVDTDQDGQLSCFDCDDSDPNNFYGNTELCDGADNDCDGATWADTAGEIDFDQDGDLSCSDCDDNDALNFNGNIEFCDGTDNDCNGLADFSSLPPGDDDDSAGDDDDSAGDDDDSAGDDDDSAGDDDDSAGDDDDSAENDYSTELDLDDDGALECDSDCDDLSSDFGPNAPELCDGFDNDCDGSIPDNELDLDGDDQSICEGDCNDDDSMTYLGAEESCDGEDNDCDGSVLDNEVDGDEDGIAPCAGDCDNKDPTSYPGATELCDGLDNDCSGGVPQEELDLDGDSVRTCGGDCDDDDPEAFPGATEACEDGTDNDCDGQTDSSDTDCATDPGDGEEDWHNAGGGCACQSSPGFSPELGPLVLLLGTLLLGIARRREQPKTGQRGWTS
jgi:hypothetical protein